MAGEIVKMGAVDRRRASGSNNRIKRIVIAGGAGFVGSHLCDRLHAQGHHILCVDNLETGRMSNINHLVGDARFEFRLHDVINPLIVEGPVDEIYNLACAASPPKYQIDPVHTFKTSILGALNLLDLARDKGARILQASTSEVYGDPEISPQPENYRGSVNTVGPRSCYDEGKRGAETLFHDYNDRYGVVTKIARIFNTYGPRMNPEDGRVVSNFVVQALSGRDITIYGTGEQTRSFCYVDDLVTGLIALMASPAEMTDPVNLGNPGEFTMQELARIVLDKTRSKSALVYRDLPVDDPRQRRPDITRARDRLGWEPTVPLMQGLDPTIAYFAAELRRNTKEPVRAS
ncbi:UDP-glucuronic acid decarboxylase family protein [Phaeovulum sp. NW3]|uniref:UDP-glucuronic acid decarboxylase family protein n=1 Tax=Phaeovulum sp. NW3 TaxID=2934933 RepID=UPI0020200E7A|nr:UDP-glucuronic acid decarboxylase family protein [Phaeovulum sp. NW3]MCL7465625.1 SDR family oxidoreductase [Phaeovulum sp. NW3]